MVKIYVILTLMLFCSFTVSAQDNILGKTYKAQIGESCRKTTEGGCMVYTFRVLEFEKDSVIITYKVKASCEPKERENGLEKMYDRLIEKYKWSITDRIINIQGFNEYGKLSIEAEKLIGHTKSLQHIGLGGPKRLEFVEERTKK